jgi:hypothetical protein
MQTSVSHTAQVMVAVRERILSLNQSIFQATPIRVEIGNPAFFHPLAESSPPLVTVWVYQLEFDNAGILPTPNTVQALRLHALITAFCQAGAAPQESHGTFELRILSHIVRLFLEEPEVGPVRITNALPVGPAASLIASEFMIEARPRTLDVEDFNNLWMTQADAPSRTSLAYSFAFGIVTPSRPTDEGPPVLNVVLEDPEDGSDAAIGVRPAMPDTAPPVAPALGVLALQMGTPAAPILMPEVTFIAGAGDQTLSVVAVTEAQENLVLALERWNGATGGWVDVTGRLSATALTSLVRASLQDGAPVTATDVTLADDGAVALLRLSASRAADPAMLSISRVTISMEAAP